MIERLRIGSRPLAYQAFSGLSIHMALLSGWVGEWAGVYMILAKIEEPPARLKIHSSTSKMLWRCTLFPSCILYPFFLQMFLWMLSVALKMHYENRKWFVDHIIAWGWDGPSEVGYTKMSKFNNDESGNAITKAEIQDPGMLESWTGGTREY